MPKKKPLGRPPKYKTPEDLQEGMDRFFKECKENEEIPTIMGMFLSLGYADKQSLHDQAKRSKDFSYIVKRAKAKCFNLKMQAGYRGEIPPTLLIWDGINNHGMINTRTNEPEKNTASDETYNVEVTVRKKVE